MSISDTDMTTPVTRATRQTVRPIPAIHICLTDDGRLRLLSATFGVYECDREATAIWIALQHRSGDVDAVATMLAELWRIGCDDVHEQVARCVEAWQAAGLLEVAQTRY